MGTIGAEGHALYRFSLVGLENSLRFVADSIEFNEVVECGEGEQIHIGGPECGGNFRSHQFLYFNEEFFIVLLVHPSNLKSIIIAFVVSSTKLEPGRSEGRKGRQG
jgi:hypothetical protein